MEFGILGPLEVVGRDGPVVVRGAKRRGLLAYLLVHAGEPMSLDRLVDDLWDQQPSSGARGTVQSYLSGFRKLVPADGDVTLETRPSGYVLAVPAERLDAACFERLCARSASETDAATRLHLVEEALALWRGAPLAEFAGSAWADVEASRLEARRLQALQQRMDARFALGRHGEAIPELEVLVGDHRLDERFWAQLMVAYYRAGRQADALRAYQRVRSVLADELGIEPGAELAELERKILDHDPALAATPGSGAAVSVPAEPLPAGVVTFLLTDVEGSTQLWDAHPQATATAMARHEELVAATVGAHQGCLVKSRGEGDSTLSAFPRASDAAAAAVALRDVLAEEAWPEGLELRTRVALHTGEAQLRGGDYYGGTLNRAARIRALAAGGEVFCSRATADLVADTLPGDVELREVGTYDLEGLRRAETVYALAPNIVSDSAAVRWDDDAPVFAPSGGAKGNLPASLDRFIGRQHELDAIRASLGERRLVTLTGPGGSGKTRLALEVARSIGAGHAGGVWLVDLAPIDDATLIAEAAMAALGLRGSNAGAWDVLRSHLAGRDTLLLVDNCEQVLGGAATLIAELLAACPLLRVLATSRAPLRVPGEAEYGVEGLGREEAVELFAERVPGQRRVDDRGAVERICAALEGIPLAVELAAAKLRVLSLPELADRLDDQLAVLARGSRTAPERQRTLRATLDWSYDLLDEDEGAVFRRLGVFAGGFTADAAQHVVADDQIPPTRVIDLLERLVERSLVTMVPGHSSARFRLLEPVRQYAAERLDKAGERNELGQRHLEWIKDFARQAFLEFYVAQHESTIRISQEHPNICQALEFAIGNGDGVTAAKIIDALGNPWYTAGQPDARLWCERVLAVVPADAPPFTRAGALVATAMMLQEALQYDAARSLLRDARELYRRAKSVRGEAWALLWLGRDAIFRAPGSAEAQTLLEEALSRYRESDVPAGAGWCLTFLAQNARFAENDDLARQRAEEAVQLGRSAHIDQVVGEGLRVLAQLDSRAGDFESADERLAELLAIHEATGDRFALILGHNGAAEQAASRGDVARAASHLAKSVELAREIPSSEPALLLVASAGYVAYVDGRASDAAVLFGAWHSLRPFTYMKRFGTILEALDNQGLGKDIAAGANLGVDAALERAVEIISRIVSDPGHARPGVQRLPAAGDAHLPLPARLGLEGVFVGRERERVRLETAFDAVRGDSGLRVALVAGEPGVGKTTLAARLARAAYAKDAVVLYGHCDEGLGIPYQPWAETLAHLVRHAPEAVLAAHVAARGGELGRLAPDLAQRVRVSPLASTDPEADRYRLFGAVVDLLVRVSNDAPVVLLLDDLHWADQPTLELMRHVVGAEAPLRLLLVATYRDTDIGDDHPLAATLAALHREPRVERVALSGLDPGSIGALLEAAAGHDLDADGRGLRDALVAETDGNPFFVTEVLRHLVETGAFRRDEDHRWAGVAAAPMTLPPTVQEVITQRVTRLGDEPRRLLSLAAVIGRDFDLDLLAAVADLDAAVVLDALEAATTAALVRPAGGTDRYTFVHALIEHALVATLSPARRRRVHARIADALEARCGDDPGDRTGELARHWIAADENASKAIDYASRAGAYALARLAPDDALHWYRQAVELLERHDEPDDVRRGAVLAGLGDAQRLTGDPAYRETLLAAADLARRLDDTNLLVRAVIANSRGMWSNASGHVDTDRVTALEAARTATEGQATRERALVLATLAGELAGVDRDRMRLVADEAVELAQRLGDDPTLVTVIARTRPPPLRAPDSLARRAALADEAVAAAERTGDPALRWYAASMSISPPLESGDIDTVHQRLDVLDDLARETGQPFMLWISAGYRAQFETLAGRLDQAEHSAREMLRIGVASGQPDALDFYGHFLIAIRRHQGRLAELVDLIEQAVADHPGLAVIRANLADGYCDADRAADARALLEGDALDAVPFDAGWTTAMTLYAKVAARVGDQRAAATLVDLLEPWRDQVATAGSTVDGSLAHPLGQVLATIGRYDDAEDAFAQAAAVNERIGAPILLAQTRLAWAGLLRDRDHDSDRARAGTLARAAHTVAAELGAGSIEQGARELLVSLDSRKDRSAI